MSFVSAVHVRPLHTRGSFVVPVSEQPVCDGLEQRGGRRIDRVVRGDAVFLVTASYPWSNLDALLFDVVLVDPLVGVGCPSSLLAAVATAEVVTDRSRLGRGCRVCPSARSGFWMPVFNPVPSHEGSAARPADSN